MTGIDDVRPRSGNAFDQACAVTADPGNRASTTVNWAAVGTAERGLNGGLLMAAAMRAMRQELGESTLPFLAEAAATGARVLDLPADPRQVERTISVILDGMRAPVSVPLPDRLSYPDEPR